MVNDNYNCKNSGSATEREVTLKDIARATGFSTMTVSRVLNNKNTAHASQENRQRILEVARRLNYRPNLAARQLVSQKNNIIVMLIDSLAPGFYHDVMVHLERLSFQHGYRLQIGMVHNNLDAIAQYVNDFIGMRIRNVICAAHNYPEFGARIPGLFDGFEHVVFLEEPLTPTRFPVIASDHYQTHRLAVERLLHGGYRRIFYLRRPYMDCAYQASRRAFFDAYAACGIQAQIDFWCHFGVALDETNEYDSPELEHILKQQPDLLMVNDDQEALTVCRLLQSRGLKVPDDVALFSVSNSAYARNTIPTVSGFEYRSKVMAERVFALLMNQIKRGGPDENPIVERVDAGIFWGESCPEYRK